MAQQNKTQLAQRVESVRAMLEKMQSQLALALPAHIKPERLARVALSCMTTQPALLDCSARSIKLALMTAAQLGLEPGVLGQGYLIPYKQVATFVPGWQGVIDLVSRSGRASAWTGAVFEGDEFDFHLGTSPQVHHRPCGESDPAKLTHVYAIGMVKDAPVPLIEVWNAARVWAHRDRFNKVGRKHYSFEHPEMYARKVVLLQVCKYLPKSVELSAALELSHRVDEGRPAALDGTFSVVEEDVEEPRESLRDRVKAREPLDAAQPVQEPADDAQDEPVTQRTVVEAWDLQSALLELSKAEDMDAIDYLCALAKQAHAAPREHVASFMAAAKARVQVIESGEAEPKAPA